MLLSNIEHFHKPYLFIPLDTGECQNFMDRTQITPEQSFYRRKEPVKTYLNFYDDSVIKDIHCIRPFIDVKNDEHTPKNGNFNQENDESIF